MTAEKSKEEKAKVYSRTKQKLTLVHLFYQALVLLIPVITPLSSSFKNMAEQISTNPYLGVALYFTFYTVYAFVMEYPFKYYSNYILEQRYELSNQNFLQWVSDYFKKTFLSLAFMLVLVTGLYALIWSFEENWWIIAWASFAGVSYIMGKLFPVFIVPLFYKYGDVENEELKQRIFALAKRYEMPLENLYSLNLSKTTKKANAAFMGIGKTKRVVLSDTLIDSFTHDEIEMVLAHELGHFKHKDIWKSLAVGLLTSFVGFWLLARIADPLAIQFGYKGVQDVAALPILFLVFYLFSLVLMPIQNGFSRWIERAADRFALEAYPNKDVFISCMKKLATVNLSDMYPNSIYEWFFFDHPSIGKRIQMAEEWKA